jgi:plasmid stabilization system protein ParE
VNYPVELLVDAQAEADVILEWLRERSPQGAMAWVAALNSAIASLSQNPERHAFAMEAKRLREPIRELFFKTEHGHRYRLLFMIEDEKVRVLRVRAPGQKPLRRKDIGNLRSP